MFDAAPSQRLSEGERPEKNAEKQQNLLVANLGIPPSLESPSSQDETGPIPLDETIYHFSISGKPAYPTGQLTLEDISASLDIKNPASLLEKAPEVRFPIASTERLGTDSLDDTRTIAWMSIPDNMQSLQKADPPSPASSSGLSSTTVSNETLMTLPLSDSTSPEMLFALYNRRTCSLLSVKDGPNENPWREVLGPLARESPALQHAVYAMAAFHARLDNSELGYIGLYHMQAALRELSRDTQKMPPHIRLATILVLAYSGWNCSVITGVQHLQGTQTMIEDGLTCFKAELARGQLSDHDRHMWRFLCNTYVYIIVMSRLTGTVEADVEFIDDMIRTVNQTLSGEPLQVDPLLGCGVTGFSIFNRVVDLVQSLRRRNETSLNMISQALALKEELEQWQSPRAPEFEWPEDPNSDPIHSIQTANAYRWAMLLYLHQSVPELSSLPAKTLSRKVLALLAATPPTSGSVIIQCFPLLTAGCESVSQEDRNWVMERWRLMSERFRIDKIETYRKITCEVWRRRDLAQSEKQTNSRCMTCQSGLQPQIQSPTAHIVTAAAFDIGETNNHCQTYCRCVLPTGISNLPRASTEGKISRTADAKTILDSSGSCENAASHTQIRNSSVDGWSTGSSIFMEITDDKLPDLDPLSWINQGFRGGRSGNVNPQTIRRRAGEDIGADTLDFDHTIKGRAHWLGVMREQGWEGEYYFSSYRLCFASISEVAISAGPIRSFFFHV